MRRVSFAAAAAVAVLSTVSASATGLPHISSAWSSRHHLVLVAQFGDLAPTTVTVATSPATERGALVAANVVFTAHLDRANTSGSVRWRSARTFRRGSYWLQVAGVQRDGVPDCPPQLRTCTTQRSNVVKVRIRR